METNKPTEVREMHTSQSSVEYTINAKGQWSSKIKVYADDISVAHERAEMYASMAETKIKEKNNQ